MRSRTGSRRAPARSRRSPSGCAPAAAQQSEAAREAGRRLDGLRTRRAEAEKQLTELREQASKLEVEEAEIRLRLEQAVEQVRRDFDCEPDAAIAAPVPEVPDGTTLPGRARELERELRLMGPVNPLALTEYEALVERHEFLQKQLDDVRNTRRELARVIKSVDEEIVRVFDSAFTDVARNFSELFSLLFPGGSGRLVLTQPDDLLNTGIEMEARPSGKMVRRLSLLSGGERSLCALAYLFSVFRARPSPFYLMDEVEAALDDVNLHRFLDLVHEFRNEAQLLVVSHQKRTMEAADVLVRRLDAARAVRAGSSPSACATSPSTTPLPEGRFRAQRRSSTGERLGQAGAVAHAEFRVDAVQVTVDGADRHNETIRDRTTGEPGRGQRRDLVLAAGEFGQRALTAPPTRMCARARRGQLERSAGECLRPTRVAVGLVGVARRGRSLVPRAGSSPRAANDSDDRLQRDRVVARRPRRHARPGRSTNGIRQLCADSRANGSTQSGARPRRTECVPCQRRLDRHLRVGRPRHGLDDGVVRRRGSGAPPLPRGSGRGGGRRRSSDRRAAPPRHPRAHGVPRRDRRPRPRPGRSSTAPKPAC